MSNIQHEKKISLLKIEIKALKEENLYLKNKIIKCNKLEDTLISEFSNGYFKNIEFIQVEIEKYLKRLNSTNMTNFEKETKTLTLLLERIFLIFSIQKKTYLWKKNLYKKKCHIDFQDCFGGR